MVPSAVTLTDHPPRAVTICNTMRATCASGTGHGTVYTPIARSRYHLRCHARNTCRWYRHRCPVSHTLWKLYRSPHCSSSCRQSTCTWYCDGTMYSTWSSWYQCGYHPSAHLTSCTKSAKRAFVFVSARKHCEPSAQLGEELRITCRLSPHCVHVRAVCCYSTGYVCPLGNH
jgi:hypothetical protein